MSTIRFQIVPPIARPDEPIFVTGNVPELGDWQPGRSLRLRWEAPFHVGEVEADLGCRLEYKITRGCWQSEAVDAYGNVPENLVHEVWLDATVHQTVAAWKDRYLGRLTTESIHSRVLAGWRELLIWLPQSYSTESGRRFPLLVMGDGDNVFNPQTSPFTGIDWAADEWVNLLAAEGVAPETIVVGVRHPEGYSDENDSLRDYDLTPRLGGAAYAEFLISDLLGHMDTHYRTQAEPSGRILAGGGLGAIHSFYTCLQHPGVFGRFSCHSMTLDGSPSTEDIFPLVSLAPILPTNTRLYFDYGTQGLDASLEPGHERLRDLLIGKGWEEGREFQVVRVEGGNHSELSWRARLGDGLRFLAQ